MEKSQFDRRVKCLSHKWELGFSDLKTKVYQIWYGNRRLAAMFLGMCSAQLKYFKTYLLNSKFNTLKQQLQSSVELTRVFDRIDFYRSKQPMRDIACEITN